MPFPARRLGGESAADAERRTRAMKPVYASVYLTHDGTEQGLTNLSPTPGTGQSNSLQFYTVATSSDALVINTLAESSSGIVRPKTNTFGFVVPRTGVYRVQAAMRWNSGEINNALAIFKNGVAVAHEIVYDNPPHVEYIGPCNTSDVFTFHLSAFLSTGDQFNPYAYNDSVKVDEMDGTSEPTVVGTKNYFTLHNVD